MGLTHITHLCYCRITLPAVNRNLGSAGFHVSLRCDLPCLPCSSPGIKNDKSYDCGYAVPLLAPFFPTGLKNPGNLRANVKTSFSV